MTEYDDILAAIEESARRQEKGNDQVLVAIGTVSTNALNLTTEIARGFAQQQQSRGTVAAIQSNGKHFVPAVLAFVAIIAGVYAMIEPMQQQIDFQTQELSHLSGYTETMSSRIMDERAAGAQIAGRFSEVQTKFDGARALVDARIQTLREIADAREQMRNRIYSDIQYRLEHIRAWQEEHDLRVVDLNAAQWERIKALERQAFGSSVRGSAGDTWQE